MFFEQNVSVRSVTKYFKMAPSLAFQESIIRVEIMGTLSCDNFSMISYSNEVQITV